MLMDSHVCKWVLLVSLASTPLCFGFELGLRDPLFQLGVVPSSPAGAMVAQSSTSPSSAPSRGCKSGPQVTYTLLDVVENALCHNQKTSAAWANVKLQAAQLGVAQSAYLPTLSGSVQVTKDRSTSLVSNGMDLSTDSSSTYRNNTLMLNWVLYDFGVRSATADNAQKLLISALASQDNVAQSVFANAVKDYYAALVAQKNIEATQEIEADAKNVFDAAVVRVQGGVAAISDQLQAKTAYSQAVFNHNKAHGDWQTALGTLAIDIGQRPDTALALIESSESNSNSAAEQELELVASVGALLESARKTHPSLRAARADLAAAQANARMVRAQGRPSISLVGRYNVNTQNAGLAQSSMPGRDRSIGIQADIPFFEGFSRTYKIQSAEAQVEGKEASLADAELQVALSVWSNYQELKVSAENLHTSQDIADSAQAAFNAAESRYQKGVANIVEVISTQTALANARQQRIAALAGWQNARIQLAASVGSMDLSALR